MTSTIARGNGPTPLVVRGPWLVSVPCRGRYPQVAFKGYRDKVFNGKGTGIRFVGRGPPCGRNPGGQNPANAFFSSARGYPFQDFGPRAAQEQPDIGKSLRKLRKTAQGTIFIFANVFFLRTDGRNPGDPPGPRTTNRIRVPLCSIFPMNLKSNLLVLFGAPAAGQRPRQDRQGKASKSRKKIS